VGSRAATFRHNRNANKAPAWVIDDVNLNDYAGVLLDFREWCAGREIEFRVGVIKAVQQFMSREGKQ
jgi:hypothetical protein